MVLVDQQEELDRRLELALAEDIEPDLSFAPLLVALSHQSSEIAQLCTTTAALADRVSHKVRLLDQEQHRIREAIEQVENAQQLIECLNGTDMAVRTERYAEAADFIQTYLRYDPETMAALFPDSVISLDVGAVTVSEAQERMDKHRAHLVEHFMEQMNAARSAHNDAEWTRFWLLFPRLGHAKTGMDKLIDDLVAALRESCQVPSNVGEVRAPSFAEYLTRLFELIAGIVDRQESIVKESYGNEEFVYLLKALAQEGELQTNKLVTVLHEKRQLDRLLRTNKPTGSSASGDDTLDVKDLSQLIEEIAAIAQRVGIFERFIKIRSGGEYSPPSNTRVSELLSVYYVAFEESFLVHSIRRAIRLSSYTPGSAIANSGSVAEAVEDCFYLFRKVISRSTGTGDVDSLCFILNLVNRTFEVEFYKELQRRLTLSSDRHDARLAFIATLNGLDESSSYLSELTQAAQEEVGRMLKFLGKDQSAQQRDKDKINSCLNPLGANGQLLKDGVRAGVMTLFGTVMRNKYKALLSEGFSNMKLVLTEEEFQQLQSQMTSDFDGSTGAGASWIDRFRSGFTKLYDEKLPLAPNLTYILLGLCVDALVANYEKLLLSATKINQLGAFRVDKDLRTLLAFFTSLLQRSTSSSSATTGMSSDEFSFRDRFGKVFQLVSLCTLDSVSDLQGEWRDDLRRVSRDEARRVLIARFGADDVARLK